MRDEFERDLDRAVYSTPFRRLQDKTQVFPLEPNDSVRTRLTHSLEVSRVARGLAKDVCQWLLQQRIVQPEQANSIETIAQTCGLIHDLGNPPFGHSGETAIRDWFCRRNRESLRDLDDRHASDFRGFEGNAQTLRLVTKLQILADFYGLNLTCGTLSAASKYIAPSDGLDKSVHERTKVGFFASEQQLVEELREVTSTGYARNPIAFIVEAADDAVYNTVDLEDGFRKGLVDWAFLKDELRRNAQEDELVGKSTEWAEGRVGSAQVDLDGTERDNALMQYFRVRAIAHMVTRAARAFIEHYQEIMAGQYHGELLVDSDAGPLLKACRAVNRSKVYHSEETLKLELMGRKIIWDLMDVFHEGVSKDRPKASPFAKKAFRLLSGNYRSVYRHAMDEGRLPPHYCRLQLVTDYVCGMTDTFAAELHRRLTNG